MESAESLYDAEEAPKVEPEVEAPTEDTGVKADEEPKTEVEEESEAAEETEKVESEKTESPSVTVPISAMHGERDRRKAAESELSVLKAEKAKSDEKDPTSVFEDEAAFRSEIQSELNATLTNQTLNQSEFFAAREYGSDVLSAKIESFKTLVKDNDLYAQRFRDAVSPYHELVTIVDQHEEMAKMKDIDGYRNTIRAEERAKVLQEIEADKTAKDKLSDSIPGSLAGDTSKGGLKGSDWSGPASAETVYDS